MGHVKAQRLNDYSHMLHAIYGRTANYGATEYELIAHLAEVTGAFGKFAFKKKDFDGAQAFLPKMFAWACALVNKVKSHTNVLEDIILRKYPTRCPYCGKAPCECVRGQKQEIDYALVRELYHRLAPGQGRAPNDFQGMLRGIYEATWHTGDKEVGSTAAAEALMELHTRLVEELSEMAEAVRFHHLYPSNFDNEVADYLSWWFAVVSSFHVLAGGQMLLAEDVLWGRYPGICPTCSLPVCDCRPEPVREMLSKPALGDGEKADALTQAGNRSAFDDELQRVITTPKYLPVPIACVRLDIDDFSTINNTWSHAVGDDALRYLATTVRHRIGARNRFFRVGGDEFAILCPDLSAVEAVGMLERAARHLKAAPITRRRPGNEEFHPVVVTISAGVVECMDPSRVEEAFELADQAAIASKKGGKDRITIMALK